MKIRSGLFYRIRDQLFPVIPAEKKIFNGVRRARRKPNLKHANKKMLVIYFPCSYTPKAPFAIRMLAFILKCLTDSNLAVS